MVTQREALFNFLSSQRIKNPIPNIWHSVLETQVNVTGEGGARINKTFEGTSTHGYTDGINTWKSFRIPYDANTNPNYNDRIMDFDLSIKADGIGTTGFNWVERCSEFVGFDFDDITGHKKGLPQTEIDNLIETAKTIPWLNMVRSKSGRGIHLFVKFSPYIRCNNHTEHAAIAKLVLNYMSVYAKFDFNSRIDCLGGIMWIWHRAAINNIQSRLSTGIYKTIDELYDKEDLVPFKLIKNGIPLDKVPGNLEDQINIVSGKARKPRDKDSDFNELASTVKNVGLDDEHLKLMKWLDDHQKLFWWDGDNHMLVCHTADLKAAHTDLNFKGIFNTVSTGKDSGHDQNCFGFPLMNGAWIFRRHNKEAKEDSYWETDKTGWTKAYFNKYPSLTTVIRAFGGLLGSKGDYEFDNALQAAKALQGLGIDLEINDKISHRRAWIKTIKSEFLVISVTLSKEDTFNIEGWRREKTVWTKVVRYKNHEEELEAPDEQIRQVTYNGAHEGWFIKTDIGAWHRQPSNNIELALKSDGLNNAEVENIMGRAIKKPWLFTSDPFKEEYPGDRRWNREAAQLSVKPLRNNTGTPTWDAILNHLGVNLTPFINRNEWCRINNVISGADYLRLWIASMFQFPKLPLPYLFLYSHEQETGKTTLHEALGRLFLSHRGYVRADNALINSSGFNGELIKAVLCVIEEIDLGANKAVLERVKDWVTSEFISIHAKRKEPIMIPNTTHWIQCANDEKYAPVFGDDTRITMIKIGKLDKKIPRHVLAERFEEETAGFLWDLFNIEIPFHEGRLRIPIIETTDKANLSAERNNNALVQYLDEKIFNRDGNVIKFEEFCHKFRVTLHYAERAVWTNNKISRDLPKYIPKGKWGEDRTIHIGNVSYDEHAEVSQPYYVSGADSLVKG